MTFAPPEQVAKLVTGKIPEKSLRFKSRWSFLPSSILLSL